MEKLLSLTLPGADDQPVTVDAPAGIPTGVSLGNLLTLFIQTALVLGVLLSLLYLVYGGWFWLQSKGDKERLDKARRIILYSIFGLIIMALSMVIVNVLAAALGVNTLLPASSNTPQQRP